MKNVSSNFRNELNNGNRNYIKSADIKLKNGTILTVDNSKLWNNGLKIENAVSNTDSFDISSVIIGQLTLTILNIDDEYYFGDSFLVAPVMNSEDCRDIYLPEGKWVNFFTGERIEGGRWLYGVKVPLDEMPVYVREGDVISVYPEDVDCTDEMNLTKSVPLCIDADFKGIWR